MTWYQDNKLSRQSSKQTTGTFDWPLSLAVCVVAAIGANIDLSRSASDKIIRIIISNHRDSVFNHHNTEPAINYLNGPADDAPKECPRP